MTKELIAVDIDDVLTFSAEGLVAYGNERFGLEQTVDDFNEHVTEMWGLSHEDAETAITDYLQSGRLATLRPIPAARPVLADLKELYRLVALTSRRDITKEVTKQYLDHFYTGIFDTVYHSGIYGSGSRTAHTVTKAEMLQELGARYLIDDQLKHCLGAVSVGAVAILHGDYAWNQTQDPLPEGVVRCSTWADIKAYFAERN